MNDLQMIKALVDDLWIIFDRFEPLWIIEMRVKVLTQPLIPQRSFWKVKAAWFMKGILLVLFA